ncbi:hypothetical protein B5M47_01245 [candidate division CPR3 bacterium 4484_211]|uniref:Histidine kinase N-terminal 7TM region domain-containing protein n=1 Tax=candidate division CPR3 bacterium 4484_211 TaxID=1968527 RepID=A0A1W9NYY1_UNCC3|nr:MAG: hypothetical protein B5M47_01245 [candidate division CPR3 bacterium 4484_211]
MISLTTVVHLIDSALFLLASVFLASSAYRKKGSSVRLFALYFAGLALASSFWATAGLVINISLEINQNLVLPASGLFYFLALLSAFLGGYSLCRLLFSAIYPAFEDILLKIVLIWGYFVLFLVAVYLPHPTLSNKGLILWNMLPQVAAALVVFVGLVSLVDILAFFLLAARSSSLVLKFRGFFIGLGMAFYVGPILVAHFRLFIEWGAVLDYLTLFGALTMFCGIVFSQIFSLND